MSKSIGAQNPGMFLPALVLILGVAPVSAAEFRISGHTFAVPAGFEVQIAAGSGVVPRPVSASFDDQGRLYVTDSSGSNAKPEEQLKNPSARVLRLEDIDGDGIFDKSVVFADKVMFPQGCLWHDGSVYVSGPPSIWKFTDTDGDGVADKREEWFKGGTLTGCANDIHGPQLGPEGYIYWTKGAFAEQTHKLGNGRTLKDKAAHIYRCRPDGSDLDVIMSGGMDNPVEIAFTPEGEAIFTSTFIDFSQPGYRDGIAHAVYGGVFGKQNEVVEDGRVKRTSPDLMHPFYQAGPAAECGLCRYESEVFGADYRDNFFATTFNLRKVTRHVLRPNGATYASTDSDFLVSDNMDFHPTDVLEDADGSLLVVDTGGWYKLCCPSSQLAKPDVLGAIYRVRKQGSGAKLVGAPRKAAYQRLTSPPTMRGNTVDINLKRASLGREVRSAGGFRDTLAKTIPTISSSTRSARDARVAAEGLGRIGDKQSVATLLQAAAGAGDAVLEHSLIFALIEIAAPAETRSGLTSEKPGTQRAAMIALDQMDGSDLKPTEVVPFLSATDERLRSAANWILARHPEWGGELAGWFRQRLTSNDLSSADRAALDKQLRILTRAEAGQQLLADAITQPGFHGETRVAALNAVANAGLKEPPAKWKTAVLAVLEAQARTGETPGLRFAAVRAARAMAGEARIAAALRAIGGDAGQPKDLRIESLAALPAGATLGPGEFDFLRASLGAANAPIIRNTAASVLARAKLDEAQLTSLTDVLKSAGPLELSNLLGAFDGGGDEALGTKLLAALRESKSAKSLIPSQLKPHFAKFPEATRKAGDEFLASLDADAAKQAAHLDALLAEMKSVSGDVRRGQAVFNSSKTACVTCHEIGYVGGKLGPDLTRIGQARNERDLLEAVVYPSLSFVRSYEPIIVVTKSGEVQSGVLRKDAADEVVLGTGPNADVRIARSDIEEMKPGAVSVMPAGLDQQLSRQELADLLAFLKDTKWGPQ